MVQHSSDAGPARNQRYQDRNHASRWAMSLHEHQPRRNRTDCSDNIDQVNGHQVARDLEAGQLVDAKAPHHRKILELEIRKTR